MTVDAAGSETTGTMEVDLVFPRNETYAPTEWFPIVFAIQNSHLASVCIPFISVKIWRWEDINDYPVNYSFQTRWANFSTSDPYFVYNDFHGFNTEGVWKLLWEVAWQSCTPDPRAFWGKHSIMTNHSASGFLFTTKRSAQAVDLVAGTGGNNCSEDAGVTFEIKDIVDVPTRVNWDGGDTCAVLSSSTPAPKPCRVKIDPAAASSIAASLTAKKCEALVPATGCPPEDESISQRLTVGGVVLLSGVLGAMGYMLL